MDSCDCDCDPHLLRSLLVFKNTINHELIKSLHVYELNEEKRNKVERKFVFRENGLYVELPAKLLLKLLKFPAFQVLQGHVNGCWICILAFHENSPPDFICIPSILSVSRTHRYERMGKSGIEFGPKALPLFKRFSDEFLPSSTWFSARNLMVFERCSDQLRPCHALQ